MLRIFVLLVLCLAIIRPAVAEEVFDREAMIGAWRGEGQLRPNPNVELERGVCRVEIAEGKADRELSLTGRCANATKSARFKTVLMELDGKGAIQAVSESRLTKGPVVLTGNTEDRTMRLRSRDPVTIKGQAYTVSLSFELQSDKSRFSMVQILKNTATGVSETVLEMVFRKK